MAYNNTIALAEKWLGVLDLVYKAASKSAILDSANSNIKFLNANTIQIFKGSSDGLADHNRNGVMGFVGGDVNLSYETLTLTQDRDRSFSIDVMDDEESINQAVGYLVGGFVREQVTPEIDAYRFATYASATGVSAATPVDITSSVDGCDLISTAEAVMGDNEVPDDGRILFVSETMYKNIKDNITRFVENGDENIKNVIGFYDDMPVIKVPATRFNSSIALNDGTTAGQTVGGYVIPTDGTSYPINFMIIHPSAVVQVIKHQIPRLWTPAQNILADAWKFDYRVYHDAFVLENKVDGIYVCTAATANS